MSNLDVLSFPQKNFFACIGFQITITVALVFFSDVGYGNYILTAPAERSKREANPEAIQRFDVPELMEEANTLTRPKGRKAKTEL